MPMAINADDAVNRLNCLDTMFLYFIRDDLQFYSNYIIVIRKHYHAPSRFYLFIFDLRLKSLTKNINNCLPGVSNVSSIYSIGKYVFINQI